MSNVSEETILENLKDIEQHGAYRFYKPLKEAADEFIRWAETPGERVYTGIKVLDDAMRGTAPGELTLIQGFTHSGKTLLATEILLNNAKTNMLLFTPDETRPLVLTKLTAARHAVGAEELEVRIQQDDASARQMLLDTAAEFGSLAIFDETVTLMDMDRMFDEVTAAHDGRPKAVMFDYAELLEGFDDVKACLTQLKAWGKRKQVAMFVIHQASRTSGSSGKRMSIDSGAYGGEQQSTHVIGVRRKKYMHFAMLQILEEKIANSTNPNSIAVFESKMREIQDILIPQDESTLTVSLNKNKRPPCKLVDDTDFHVDKDTGRMRREERGTDGYGNPIRTTKAALSYLQQKPAQTWADVEIEF